MADRLFQKEFREIGPADIERLVTDGVVEGVSLDYKQELPGNGDADRKEFLADLSSFSNAAGGYLLFGVEEKRDANGRATGIPLAADGLEARNPGAEIARLENLIRDGIEPRIAGINVKDILMARGPAILFRIPRSWIAPHMVSYKGHTRFYARNNTGKYPMNVGEIRSAFALSEELPERVRTFREHRLSAVRSDTIPIPVATGAKIVLHLAPFSAFVPGARVDVATDVPKQQALLQPIYMSAGQYRFNFDGFLATAGGPEQGRFKGYIQVFRSGIVEAIDSGLLAAFVPAELHPGHPQGRFIPSAKFERSVIDSTGRYLMLLERVGVEPPIASTTTDAAATTIREGCSHANAYSNPRSCLYVGWGCAEERQQD